MGRRTDPSPSRRPAGDGRENYWHLHHETNGRHEFVTELHSDIVPEGMPAGGQVADVFATIAQELSQPLAALGGYISGTQRALQRPWPDRARLDQGITEAIAQLARASQVLSRVRALGENLRDPRLRQSHARLRATLEQTERIVQTALQVTRASGTTLAETALACQKREATREPLRSPEQPSLKPSERAAFQRNIQLLQRLLRQDESEEPDVQTERALRRLLADEKVKLAALDEPEAAPI